MGGCVGMYGRGMGVWMHGGREEHILRVYRRDSYVCTKLEEQEEEDDDEQNSLS